MTSTPRSSLRQFPIDGKAVSNALSAVLSPADKLVLRQIETLTSSSSTALGDLWRQAATGAVEIELGDLVSALTDADQVVTLDLVLMSHPLRTLLIEDGELITDSLLH